MAMNRLTCRHAWTRKPARSLNVFLKPQIYTSSRWTPQSGFHTAQHLSSQGKNNLDTKSGSPISPEQAVKDNLAALNNLLESSQKTGYETLNVHDFKAANVGHIRLLSFNRPKAMNAISKQLLQDLANQIENIHAEKHAGETRALILASEIPGAFCAGADLAERKTMSAEEVNEFLTKLRYTFKRIADLPIPSISCVAGYALGGGLELALCTHLRVFSWTAQVGLPETRLAIIPGGGGTYRLPQVVGLNKARELILDARRLKAREALEIGLCNRLVESDSPGIDSTDKELARKLALSEAITWAHSISNQGPIAIRAAIRAMRNGGSETDENAAYELVIPTKDRSEALTAFAEKRQPRFIGE